jgi:hypothetical protein
MHIMRITNYFFFFFLSFVLLRDEGRLDQFRHTKLVGPSFLWVFTPLSISGFTHVFVVLRSFPDGFSADIRTSISQYPLQSWFLSISPKSLRCVSRLLLRHTRDLRNLICFFEILRLLPVETSLLR